LQRLHDQADGCDRIETKVVGVRQGQALTGFPARARVRFAGLSAQDTPLFPEYMMFLVPVSSLDIRYV
jgi:hypothetical protein